MNIVGKSEVRVDAFDKATGRTKYYDDLAPKDALLIRVKHSTIAHGFVKSVDISKAEKIPGVVKVLTCFDVPEHCAPPCAGDAQPAFSTILARLAQFVQPSSRAI